MIRSLHIANFKNLVNLNITDFSRVNLISGKNNVGKSTLLEALRLFISDEQLPEILKGRGEIIASHTRPADEDLIKRNYSGLASLFTNRNTSVTPKNRIVIKDGDNTMTIRFFFFVYQQVHSGDETLQRMTAIENPDDYPDHDVSIGLEISRNNDYTNRIPLHRNLRFLKFIKANSIKLICVNYNYDNSEFTSKLWDEITLTDKEEFVIKALRIVEPNIENLAFLEDPYSGNRYPVAKVKGLNGRVPLKSMGDGINHILAITLAIVNCENGCVIIDEIDNGLHYSVQKQLWDIIFNLAKSLNVQIFATTHSSDCISSFSKALNEAGNKDEGRFIRLETKNSVICYTEYSPTELEIVAAQNIEIR